MKIKTISVTNVKSFNNKTVIDFDTDFNIIIGPNAAGKSNLLDILTICLRQFFLYNYRLVPDQGKLRLEHNSPFQNIPLHLDKYLGSSADSLIELTFIIKKEDLDNIQTLKSIKGQVEQRMLSEILQNGVQVLNEFRRINWDEAELKEEELLTYQILNSQPESVDPAFVHGLDKHEMEEKKKKFLFQKYLNLFNFYALYGGLNTTKQLKNPFLFLSSYRGVGTNSDFQGNLSSQDFASSSIGLQSTTSKSTTSLINMATLYFSAKRRQMETNAVKEGFEILWAKDPEVIMVTRYLDKLGYKWNIELIDPLKNIYEIRLEKDSHKLLLNQASSGEKEIINYLFGIFSLRISNGLIIIDEPELHLHPRWQLLLLELFIDLTRQTGNQFVITTHSPVFINMQSVTNLIRIYKEKNESKHVSIKEISVGSIKDLLHLVNSTNNEKIFFADLVILVEGITDRLVFQRILAEQMKLYGILSVVEVVEINGKGNIKKFRKYLKAIKIPYYFIADLDYINEVGTTKLKSLFAADLGNVDNNAIKNPKSTDGKRLIEILEESINNKNFEELTTFLKYIKSFRLKLKDPLTADERKSLSDFIKARKSNNEYILSLGYIEKYFPIGYSTKDLDKVIALLEQPQFMNWQVTEEYKQLELMIYDILDNAGLIAPKASAI